MKVMYSTSRAEGKKAYSEDVESSDFFAAMHSAMDFCYQRAHVHHSALLLPALVRKVSAGHRPHHQRGLLWDFLYDSEAYGGLWYAGSELFQDSWFGAVDIDKRVSEPQVCVARTQTPLRCHVHLVRHRGADLRQQRVDGDPAAGDLLRPQDEADLCPGQDHGLVLHGGAHALGLGPLHSLSTSRRSRTPTPPRTTGVASTGVALGPALLGLHPLFDKMLRLVWLAPVFEDRISAAWEANGDSACGYHWENHFPLEGIFDDAAAGKHFTNQEL